MPSLVPLAATIDTGFEQFGALGATPGHANAIVGSMEACGELFRCIQERCGVNRSTRRAAGLRSQ
jgi:hypothetical protein